MAKPTEQIAADFKSTLESCAMISTLGFVDEPVRGEMKCSNE